MSKSRNISTGTIKSLYAHSGNKCAFPNCSAVLVYDEIVFLDDDESIKTLGEYPVVGKTSETSGAKADG